MLLIAAALFTTTDPAAVATPQTAPVQAANPLKGKKICKVDENESSSRLRKRVCLTQSEWERKETGKSADDLKTIGAR